VTVKKDDAAARELVAHQGGVQPLVQLLYDTLADPSDPDADAAAEAAALALCHLARSKELRSDISAAQGLQALVALLSDAEENGRSPASLKNGMLALVNLATLEPNRALLR
jgi:predicted membrane-bound mannosyltransferase